MSARAQEGRLAACGSWVLLCLPLVGLWMSLGSPPAGSASERVLFLCPLLLEQATGGVCLSILDLSALSFFV